MTLPVRPPIVLTWLAVAALMAASLVLAGFGFGTVAAQDDATTPRATLRIVHAISGGPEVDVLLGGEVLAEAVPFGTVSEFIPVAPGDHVIQIVPAGQPAEAAIVQADLTVEGARSYIVVALGTPDAPEGRVYEVNLDEMMTGMARGRFINVAPEAGSLDLAPAGGEPLFSDVGFGDASDYIDLAPGTSIFDLRGDDDQVVSSIADVTIEESLAYDMVAVGPVADGSLTMLTLSTAVDPSCSAALGLGGAIEDACVRHTHAAPDSADVDIYVNDVIAAEGLSFSTVTEFVTLPSGDAQIFSVTAAGSPIEEAFITTDLGLDPGQAYEVLVTGDAEDPQLTITGIDLRPVPAGQARVGVIHTSPDAGSVNIRLDDGTAVVEGLDFRGVSEYKAIDEGTYEIQVSPAGDDQAVLLTSELQVTASIVYDIVVVGRSESQTLAIMVLTAPVPVQAEAIASPVASPGATPVEASGG